MLHVCPSTINRVTLNTFCLSACLSLCLCFCLGFRISFRSCLLQFTPILDLTWHRDMKLTTNQFQSASAHMTLCQQEIEISLSFTRPNNASWGYNHSVTTPVGLREVPHVWSITPNRVTFNTMKILSKGDATTYPWPAPFDGVGATENE